MPEPLSLPLYVDHDEQWPPDHLRLHCRKRQKGLTITNPYDKMGVRGSDTAEIILDNVRVPAHHILGDQTRLQAILYTLGNWANFDSCLICWHRAGTLDASLSYAKGRKQFGQTLSSFQAIQFKLADGDTNRNSLDKWCGKRPG
ncbi:acyl-CoA dehydrogenase family protein [Bacillus sp. SL00103]